MSEPSAHRRLLVVLKSDGVGGVERFLAGMIPAFRAHGVTVELACHGRPPREPGLLGGELRKAVLDDLEGRIRLAQFGAEVSSLGHRDTAVVHGKDRFG